MFAFARKIRFWFLLVLLAGAVLFAIAQIATPLLGRYSTKIKVEINKKSPFPLDYKTMQVQWSGSGPRFIFHHLKLTSNQNKQESIKVPKVVVHVNLLGTLWKKHLVTNLISIEHLNLHLFSTNKGEMKLRDFSTAPTGSSSIINRLILLLEQHRLMLTHSEMSWQNAKGERIQIHMRSILLKRHSGTDRDAGTFTLTAKKLRFRLTPLFAGTLPSMSASGTVHWQRRREGHLIFQLPKLKLQNADLKLYGDVGIDLERDKSPLVNILGTYTVFNTEHFYLYLPVGILDDGLENWLKRSIKSAEGAEGDVVLRGRISDFPFDQQEGSFIINANIHDATLDYQAKWPLLKNLYGKMNFSHRTMIIDVESGTILGSTIEKTHIKIPEIRSNRPVMLEVTGKADGDSADGLSMLRDTPLYNDVGKYLKPIEINGPMHLDLFFTIPVNNFKIPIRVEGRAKFSQSQLVIPGIKLSVNRINGDLDFTQSTLRSSELKGTLFDYPVMAKIDSIPYQKRSSIEYLKIDLKGKTKMAPLLDYLHLPFKPFIFGETEYDGLLKLWLDGRTNLLEVNTALDGVAVLFSDPLAKPARESESFKTKLWFGKKESDLKVKFHYADRAQGAFRYLLTDGSTEFHGGELRIGQGEVSYPKERGLLVTGAFNELSWDRIKALLKEKDSHSSDVSGFEAYLRQIKLTFKKIKLLGQVIKNAKVTLEPKEESWWIHVESRKVLGDLLVPETFPRGLLEGQLHRVIITPGNRDSEEPLLMEDFPDLDIEIDRTTYGEKYFGHVSIQAEHNPEGVALTRVNAGTKDWQLNAKGQWSGRPKFYRTTLQGKMKINHLEHALQDWDSSPSMSNRHGSADFSVHWVGAPSDYAFQKVKGTVSLRLGEGRFLKITQEAEAKLGMGRIFNILSITSLARRIRLDFSDITKKGFPFDKLEGRFRLANGNATTRKTFMKGPIADMIIRGRIGIKSEDMDCQLTVVPHVTGSIPVVAAIAGGPVAGVAAWVVNRVVGPAVTKATSYHYHLQGDWDSPKLTEIKKVNESDEQRDT